MDRTSTTRRYPRPGDGRYLATGPCRTCRGGTGACADDWTAVVAVEAVEAPVWMSAAVVIGCRTGRPCCDGDGIRARPCGGKRTNIIH